jgi:hypothetical protein
MGKDSKEEKLSANETAARERSVFDHFLTTKPTPHKPLGKNPQAKRRKREKEAK